MGLGKYGDWLVFGVALAELNPRSRVWGAQGPKKSPPWAPCSIPTHPPGP